MSDIRIHTLRTIAKTPWGFMGYAATTLEEVNPVTIEQAQRDNLRVVQKRLTPGGNLMTPMTFPGHRVPTPVADTTITVAETLVEHDPMGEGEEKVERFEEYEIPYGKMTG